MQPTGLSEVVSLPGKKEVEEMLVHRKTASYLLPRLDAGTPGIVKRQKRMRTSAIHPDTLQKHAKDLLVKDELGPAYQGYFPHLLSLPQCISHTYWSHRYI